MGVPAPPTASGPGTGWSTRTRRRAGGRRWPGGRRARGRAPAGARAAGRGRPAARARPARPPRWSLPAGRWLAGWSPACRHGRRRPACAGLPAGRAGARELVLRDGRVVRGGRGRGCRRRSGPGWRRCGRTWPATPFLAPEADRLAELGLGRRELGRRRPGRRAAAGRRRDLPAARAPTPRRPRCWPACRSRSRSREARQALGTTRRVAVPLLELLDARGRTRRAAGRPPHGRRRRRLSATHVDVCRARGSRPARLPAAERVLRVEHLDGPAVEPAEELAKLGHLTSSLASSSGTTRGYLNRSRSSACAESRRSRLRYVTT